MIPLADLIALYRQHVIDYGHEIDLAIARHNAAGTVGDPVEQEATLRDTCAVWRQAQREARDTVSYLEALQRRIAISGGRVSS